MGKKKDNKKKGKGAEKTSAKTVKKLDAKQKKELAALGEDDIEKVVAEIEKEEKRRLQVIETQIEAPTRRLNASFVAHPEKDELIMFGGEYFNGQKTFLYNDLLFYNIPNNKWTLVKAPSGPAPRCGHQMIATSSNKGQLWVFGGEYASPTQTQFYHYKDLWVYHIANKQWEKIAATGGPSARSGHRMILMKKQLILFGGFHENLREFKYFNDIYAFNLETRTWTKLEPTGTAPAPRSGCIMAPLQDGRILIYGGYSKERIKKDFDKGRVFTDSFLLTPDKNDTTGTKYKWISTKIGGIHFSPRCGMPLALAPNNSAYCFGGVFDVEDDEENLAGSFFNELYSLDVEKLLWRNVNVTGKREQKTRKNAGNKDEDGTLEEEVKMDEDDKEVAKSAEIVADDGVFKVTVGPAPAAVGSASDGSERIAREKIFQPSARMNCSLVVKRSVLYLYGGMYEDGDKQLTLNDFYSLDLHKLDEWKTITSDDVASQEWIGSDSESDEDKSDSEESDEDDESQSDSPMDTD